MKLAHLALAAIVTEVQLPDGIVCNSTLWAARIGGATVHRQSRVGWSPFRNSVACITTYDRSAA